MNSDNTAARQPSFFDDDDISIGFPFAKYNGHNAKDISVPATIETKLSRQINADGPLLIGSYALHRQTITYTKISSNTVDSVLCLDHAQVRTIPLDTSTGLSGFSITKNCVKHEFFSDDEEVVQNWITALKTVCIFTSFHEEYKAIKMIGKGSFAKVYLVESKSTNKNFAVKAFTKESLVISNKNNARPSMINEIDIMRVTEHENIIKLYEVYETERSIYLVLELIQGKSLQDVLKKSGFKDNEPRTLNVISSILDALAYLASKGIMHRDLKPDNILIDKGDKVKIVDFGLATFIDVPEYIFKKCGTPGYIAPEVFKYDPKNPATFYNDRCDAFSAGCILYYMLFGNLFFDGTNASEILKANRRFTVEFPPLSAIKDELKNPNSKITAEGLDLLTKLLDFDQKKRMSSSESLGHPYLAAIMQQKLSGSYDVYQQGGFSPVIFDKRGSLVSEQVIQQMMSNKNVNSPHRFAEKDSLYLDVGKPEINGKIDTLTSGSNNNSLLLTRADSNGNSAPNSASSFAKNLGHSRSFKAHNTAGKPSFLKAAIIRNMQMNNSESEEAKDESPDIKSERRHSDFIPSRMGRSSLLNSPEKPTSHEAEEAQASDHHQASVGKVKSPSKLVSSPVKKVSSTFQGQKAHEKGL